MNCRLPHFAGKLTVRYPSNLWWCSRQIHCWPRYIQPPLFLFFLSISACAMANDVVHLNREPFRKGELVQILTGPLAALMQCSNDTSQEPSGLPFYSTP